VLGVLGVVLSCQLLMMYLAASFEPWKEENFIPVRAMRNLTIFYWFSGYNIICVVAAIEMV
jgi:hypothetical protein